MASWGDALAEAGDAFLLDFLDLEVEVMAARNAEWGLEVSRGQAAATASMME